MNDPAKDIGLKILAALGIPSNGVRSITIRVEVGKVPTVTIEKLTASTHGIETALQGYQLTEIANEP